MKKQFICASLCLALLSSALVTSCGSDVVSTAEYSIDNTATELTAAVNAVLPVSSELAAPDPALTMAMFGDAAEHFETFSVLTNASGMTQDEYGIFKVDADENVAAVETAIKSYLADKLAAFTGDYTPEEKPKLENATVKIFGRFVVYCILSEENTELVMTTVENTLLGK